jgi:hypothetical protein
MPNAASSLRTCQRGHMFSPTCESICKNAANRPTDYPATIHTRALSLSYMRVVDADKVAAAFLRLPMLHITQTAELFSKKKKKNALEQLLSLSHTMAKFPIGGCKFACQSSFMICYVCWSCFCSCCLCLVWTFCNKLRCSKSSCLDQYIIANASID